MEFVERIEANQERLTEADQRVLAVLLHDRMAGTYLPARTVASRAGVHESTAGRLAAKLGFEGYRQMRAALQSELSQERGPASAMANRLSRMGGSPTLEALVGSELGVLAELPRQVTQQQVTAAATMLAGARRIILFGSSHAGSLAEMMGARLVRAGYDALVLKHVDWSAAQELVRLDSRDVLVAIEFRQASRGLKTLARLFGEIGAGILAITDTPALLSQPAPQVTLWASRGDPLELQSLAVPLVITNAIVVELSRIDAGKTLDALARFAELRSRLDIDHASAPAADRTPPGPGAGRAKRTRNRRTNHA
jgi:DNA-binding MurR/RpiR family transcriptional regulator